MELAGGAVLLAALAAAILDQTSKALVTARLAGGTTYGWGWIGFRRIANRRLAPLPVSDRAAMALWVVALAGIVVALAVAPPPPAITAVGLGLSLGGAAGNLIDRLARGAVVDFIVVWRWPTFNLADAALVAGVGLVALGLL
jgi:signal peptidase II